MPHTTALTPPERTAPVPPAEVLALLAIADAAAAFMRAWDDSRLVLHKPLDDLRAALEARPSRAFAQAIGRVHRLGIAGGAA